MKLTASIILLALTTTFSFGQQCLECRKKFDRLIEIEQQDHVSDSELDESLQIAKDLYEKRYTDYIDSISNNTIHVSKNLTHTFANITRKRCESKGVSYYIDYLIFTSGSAEEERSFGLERLFKECPETVLQTTKQSYILDIAWGFVNNRLYGPIDPFEDDGYKAMTVYENSPRTELNSDNYKEIFHQTYPTLTSNEAYSEEIKLLLKKIAEILEEE